MSYFIFITCLLFLSVFGVSATIPEVPTDVQGVYLGKLDLIATCWQPAQRATYYQVLTVFPDLTTQYVNVTQPRFVLENLEDSLGTYAFAVRQWDGWNGKYSDFSEEITVEAQEAEVPKIENATIGMVISVNINETSTFTWTDAPKELSDSDDSSSINTCLTFTMETCLRVSQYKEWTTPESFVMDVRILESPIPETNRTETVYLKQHTIHYDKVHTEFLGYTNVSCRSVTSNQLQFDVEDLYKDYNYTYWVRAHLGGRFLGTYDEGSFKGTGYVEPVIVVYIPYYDTPVGVYLLTTGSLLALLLISFVLSIVCGWDRVVNDVAVRKDKMNKQKEAEMYEQIRGKLLTHSFINDRTQRRSTQQDLYPL